MELIIEDSSPLPAKADIYKQVDKLRRDAGLLSQEAEFLRFLVGVKLEEDYYQTTFPPKVKDLAERFCRETGAKRNEPEPAARDLMRRIRPKLYSYYFRQLDPIVIIPLTGEETGYEPKIFVREEAARRLPPNLAQPKPLPTPEPIQRSDATKLVCRGNNVEAMAYLTSRIQNVKRIEDTAIRWDITPSFYAGEVFERFQEELSKAFAESHNEEGKIEYRSITSSVTDPGYAKGLRRVFAFHKYPEIQCFRLHHAVPMMNFVLLYERSNDALEVLFGYGIQTSYTDVSHTRVFSSTDPDLTQAFQELFGILRSPRFARPISVIDDEFSMASVRRCDVLATYPSLPKDEIQERIRDAASIVICVTASHLLERELYALLEEALDGKCEVRIALWEPDSEFMKLRDKAIHGRPGYPFEELDMNLKTVELLKQRYPDLDVLTCHGQGSVSLFMIDDWIYFSPYWVGRNVSDGPHFLVHRSSDTGQKVEGQFEEMLRSTSTEAKSTEPSAKTVLDLWREDTEQS